MIFVSFFGRLLVAYTPPTLSQFFADVRFIHADDMDHKALLDALSTYDRIYIESVERYFFGRAKNDFEASSDQS